MRDYGREKYEALHRPPFYPPKGSRAWEMERLGVDEGDLVDDEVTEREGEEDA